MIFSSSAAAPGALLVRGARPGMAPRWAWPSSSRLGGTCVIRGCVPKKLMHYGAHFAESFRQASGYGWRLADAPQLDFQALLEARNAEIQRLNGIYAGMLEKAGVTVHVGRALIIGRVGSRFRIEVGGDTVSADRVLVAVGARPAKPAVRGIEHTATSDEILENVYPMPKRLAVVGAGYIGVELASIMNALGVDTRIILRADMPLRGFDEDLRRHMTTELEERGLGLVRNTTVSAIEKAGDGFRLVTSSGPIEADRVVYATGRPPLPNTSWLGLADLGVDDGCKRQGARRPRLRHQCRGHLRRRRLHRPRRCRARRGQHDLTPVAIAEGRVIAETLFNDNPHEVAYGSIPTAIFGLPQAATVGLSESAARAAGHAVTIFETRFRPMLYTLTGDQHRTYMKIVVDADTDRVLGCAMVGDDAAEMVQGLAIALTAGATKAQFDATVGVHPSAAEEFVTMYQPAER